MVREVLQTRRVRLHTSPANEHGEDRLIRAGQILHMSPASSSEQASVKRGKRAPSHIRLMSRPSIPLVNILPRYEGPKSTSSRPYTDASARATASSERNAHWHISFQMEEG